MKVPEKIQKLKSPETLAFELSLLERFPTLFRALYEEDLSKYKVPLQQRGVEIEKGWWPILEKLSQGLQLITDKVYFSQIKQKFGYFTAYIEKEETIDPTVYTEVCRHISMAVDEALKSCETCGKTGTIFCTEKTYLYCACEEHRQAKSDVCIMGELDD